MWSVKNIITDYCKTLKKLKRNIIIFILTLALNFILYIFFIKEGTDANLSNIYSWFTSMIFAFGMYKLYVINDNDYKPSKICRDFGKYSVSNMVFGIISIAIFYMLYSKGINQPLFEIDGFTTKIIVTLIEILLNILDFIQIDVPQK